MVEEARMEGDQFVARARELVPVLRERAAEADRLRRVPVFNFRYSPPRCIHVLSRGCGEFHDTVSISCWKSVYVPESSTIQPSR